MTRFPPLRLVFPLAALALVAGCGAPARADRSAPTPASYAIGGVATPYYGEELFDGRIYVFGSRRSHESFKASHQPDPLRSKTFIKRGPHGETVVVETDKDQPQQFDRLWQQFRERYGIA